MRLCGTDEILANELNLRRNRCRFKTFAGILLFQGLLFCEFDSKVPTQPPVEDPKQHCESADQICINFSHRGCSISAAPTIYKQEIIHSSPGDARAFAKYCFSRESNSQLSSHDLSGAFCIVSLAALLIRCRGAIQQAVET